MKGSTIVLIGAAVGAYLLLSGKGNGESGTGGSLDLPLAAIFDTGGGDPYNPAVSGGSGQLVPSQTILDAMAAANKKKASTEMVQVQGTLGTTFQLPSGSVPSGSSLTLSEYGKTIQGLGIHTQDAYVTSSSKKGESMVFLNPLSSSTPPGGSIHAVAAISSPISSISFSSSKKASSADYGNNAGSSLTLHQRMGVR